MRRTVKRFAFGWAAHFCFGAPLARMEGQIAFATLLRRIPLIEIEREPTEVPLVWRQNLGLRGLQSLPVRFTTDVPAHVDASEETAVHPATAQV